MYLVNKDYYYCVTQSAPDAFASLGTSAELTPVRIILGHCTRLQSACPCSHWRRRPGRPRHTWLRYRERGPCTQSAGSGDSSTACAEQNSLADTRGNGYTSL